ncbi:unnamed protein product [Vitrella brassicaformis CCMP3155]|uniref:Uncharacterized protein n=1 Tax=Vitrella brassicaformis (strain CCMP3155) TaxID=1169540 RepID=A0A0G4EY50_VITBC|nr:unnamed protein product [Vitrella brassicaformis CCMP3155]|eukprot:CEM03355.1 unnamed protein product [Vitrella brassicaformis CCMP3155]
MDLLGSPSKFQMLLKLALEFPGFDMSTDTFSASLSYTSFLSGVKLVGGAVVRVPEWRLSIDPKLLYLVYMYRQHRDQVQPVPDSEYYDDRGRHTAADSPEAVGLVTEERDNREGQGDGSKEAAAASGMLRMPQSAVDRIEDAERETLGWFSIALACLGKRSQTCEDFINSLLDHFSVPTVNMRSDGNNSSVIDKVLQGTEEKFRSRREATKTVLWQLVAVYPTSRRVGAVRWVMGYFERLVVKRPIETEGLGRQSRRAGYRQTRELQDRDKKRELDNRRKTQDIHNEDSEMDKATGNKQQQGLKVATNPLPPTDGNRDNDNIHRRCRDALPSHLYKRTTNDAFEHDGRRRTEDYQQMCLSDITSFINRYKRDLKGEDIEKRTKGFYAISLKGVRGGKEHRCLHLIFRVFGTMRWMHWWERP